VQTSLASEAMPTTLAPPTALATPPTHAPRTALAPPLTQAEPMTLATPATHAGPTTLTTLEALEIAQMEAEARLAGQPAIDGRSAPDGSAP